MNEHSIKNIVEGALLAAGKPLSVAQLEEIFNIDDAKKPSRDQIRHALKTLSQEYEQRAIELKHVGSGYRMQVRQEYSRWISRLSQEKAPRYSRALLETLAIIVYRQPITRGDIEDIRGVAVSSNIIKTLLEREWIRVVGHRDVPGKPAMFGTTKAFLDYFNLRSLDQLPTLASFQAELDKLISEPQPDVSDQTDSESPADSATA